MRGSILLALLTMALLPRAAAAQLAERQMLTLAAVKRVAAAAEAEAVRNNWNVVIAIVDDAGHPLWLQRMDGVQIASIEVALAKARTAALYRRPTKAFADAISGGNQLMAMLPDVMPLEGGVPIIVNGQVLGAVGVSGVTAQQDGVIAAAGIAALDPGAGP
jgi:glc operon protein GlcG